MVVHAHLGAVFPQDEIEPNPSAIKSYLRGVEELGFDHIVAADHVLGADQAVHQQAAPFGRPDPYTLDNNFWEPFVLFGFVAAVSRLGVMTSVLALPQRQTALVAKQTATVDHLLEGRLRLGVGLGYIQAEFEALGVPFGARGRRFEEMISVLRRLWTEQSVTMSREFHTLNGVGLAPRPVQRPIPVWIGTGDARPALERVGRIADGWLPLRIPGFGFEQDFDVVRAAAEGEGRDPSQIGIQGRVQCRDRDVDRTRRQVARWIDAGASYVGIDTEQAGLKGQPHDAHLELLAKIAQF
ncbi:LLM class F420-dependent oxidoreductase [Nocardioides sp. YIM 152315]|uniref:LLM class F420-dependent oxidoreductase n=1 Tax=Nocardioides sp. YIM 152315 TaxID=3031760 RepID=UPI0023DC22E2|nr:LLM class F420-dependent oxidoreductase [Nocardioides sp. YIM 152315]MDF1602226.1 LLM class F420-dependent oxidoreductase [Nocardioides sp. YIM 152315]